MDYTDFLNLMRKFNIRIELPLIEERQFIRDIDNLIHDIDSYGYDRGYDAGYEYGQEEGSYWGDYDNHCGTCNP